VVPGRTGTVYAGWLAARGDGWKAQVRFTALDPFRDYATALATELPHAVRVLDAFHVVKLGLGVVDEVHRRVQQGHLDPPRAQMRPRCMRSTACCGAADRLNAKAVA
jgi:transposase